MEGYHMKRLLYIILVLTMLTATWSCHKDYDDFFTVAQLQLTAGDTCTVEKVQGTVTVTNLSNGQSFSSSTFEGDFTTIEVMRGPYSVAVEGTISLRHTDGTSTIHQFRASENYCELLRHPSVVKLSILLMS